MVLSPTYCNLWKEGHVGEALDRGRKRVGAQNVFFEHASCLTRFSLDTATEAPHVVWIGETTGGFVQQRLALGAADMQRKSHISENTSVVAKEDCASWDGLSSHHS
ncbi:hypothetical protein SPBR_02136 [Sporothrix brasiliensis 5110]|uniref:Uncharacterized protein n=1 Tax=Sporothrix brasiliensis 5110 TaxID=1398154 RepID=A0A0C2IQQ7_9PEZI|nr:uncharacterized protein SPBR_02136 [Sporothrix brasiliensis 5110]KIH91366.1 hypothetical protein SPBR_02136 [Sporothrix brasiliensis 5110]